MSNPRAERFKNEGNEFFKHKDYDSAAECYQQAINLDPTNAIYYSNLAACSLAVGEYADAIQYSEKAIQLSPQYEKAHFRLVQAYSGSWDTDKALQALRNCHQMLTEKYNNSIPTEMQKIIEQKGIEVRKRIVEGNCTKKIRKIILRDGKFNADNVESIAQLIDRASLKTNGKSLSMEEIFDLFTDFELEDMSEVDSYCTAKEIVSKCLKPGNQNEINIGLQSMVHDKYIKKGLIWHLLFVPNYGITDATGCKKLEHCQNPILRDYTVQVYEVFTSFSPIVIERASFKQKHDKFGFGFQLLRGLCLAIIKAKANTSSSNPQFLPDKLMIYGADYFHGKAEAILNYGLITQLPAFNNVMHLSRDEIPSMISFSLDMANRMAAPKHPFIRSAGLRSANMTRLENFSLEFGRNLFESMAELASLEPWKYISLIYPLHVSITHSKVSDNMIPNPSEILKQLLKNDSLGVEGLEYMDGRERLVCIMGCTDPDATGFSILKNMKEFSQFVGNPNLVPEIPSVQYGTISNISFQDLDDIKAYSWPIHKGQTYNFYPFVVTFLKNFFNTTDENLLKRPELKDLKWIEAFCRGLSQFIRKCVKHPPLRGLEDYTNFLVTDEFTKTGIKIQTTDGEAVFKLVVGRDKDNVVKKYQFQAQNDEEVKEKMAEIAKEWKKEMETPKACAVCGATNSELISKKLLVCGKCKKVHYCSQACQAADWKTHKKVCE